ncbi:hypothetical protein X798_02698 [Onchocerca flexuosa]|uniref:Uncharacterized protein n=2 Tax=Onchocerca flexuosa TaxID=387005 RepID=A0A183I2F8_9BILA|nr:hypothetical protein X798_02698 [Onchocerca flexuosa]VDP15010.1 unnamed protein product [Onchocerca flexuosa]
MFVGTEFDPQYSAQIVITQQQCTDRRTLQRHIRGAFSHRIFRIGRVTAKWRPRHEDHGLSAFLSFFPYFLRSNRCFFTTTMFCLEKVRQMPQYPSIHHIASSHPRGEDIPPLLQCSSQLVISKMRCRWRWN